MPSDFEGIDPLFLRSSSLWDGCESILKSCGDKINVTLVDFNPVTLALAKNHLRRFKALQFIQLDAYALGARFPKEFDIVICLDFLHHSANISLLLDQIDLSLKPGGIFIANAFAQHSYADWDRLKYGMWKSMWRRGMAAFATRVYYKSPRFVKHCIRSLGLARIAPISRSELERTLEAKFASFDLIENHYFWISARKVLSE